MISTTNPVRRDPTLRRVRAPLALMSAVALGALVAAPGALLAVPRSDFQLAADGRLVDVQVQVDGRGTTPLYTAPGRHDRRYFQAFQGRNYSLVIRNTTGDRVGVLIAVDGLNVISGERSALSRGEAMYVLDPHERAVIRGWRTSLDEVRRFVFVDEQRSYAERTGQANGDMGWIRVLAFREQQPFREGLGKIRRSDEGSPYGAAPSLDDDRSRSNEGKDQAPPSASGELRKSAPRAQAQEAPGSPARELYGGRQDGAARESNPGTGWGQRQSDPVNRTWFVAEAYPVDRITLRYEYANGLRALGIFPRDSHDRLWEREHGQLGFAKPPQW